MSLAKTATKVFMGNSTPPFITAIVRGLYGAVLLGVSALLYDLRGGEALADALVTGAIASVGYLIVRAGAEGIIDQNRNGGKKGGGE